MHQISEDTGWISMHRVQLVTFPSPIRRKKKWFPEKYIIYSPPTDLKGRMIQWFPL